MRAESTFESTMPGETFAELGYHGLFHSQTRNIISTRGAPIARQPGASGFPDICFAGRGRVGFIECKTTQEERGGDIDTGR